MANISLLNEQIPEDVVVASGTQRDFSLSWKAREAQHVKVSFAIDNSAGTLPEPPDIAYTVSQLDDPNANIRVVFDEFPTEGQVIIFELDMPIERQIDYTQSGAFRATTVNGELVDVTLILQQLNRQGLRSVSLNPVDALSNTTPTLPAYAPGHVPYWSKTARKFTSISIDDLLGTDGTDGEDGEDASRAAGIYYADDIGLAGDGVTDDTGTLSKFMADKVEAGETPTIVLFSALGFFFNDRVKIPSNVRFHVLSPCFGSDRGGLPV